MIRVLLTDDHIVVTEGIKLLLSEVNDITCVAEARNGQQALDILQNVPIDVALLDIEMPVMDGIKCTELIAQKYPDVKIVAISIYADYPHVQSMIKAGAKGYLLKNCGKMELEQCIRKVHAGGTFFSDDLTETLLAGMQGKFVKKQGSSQFLPTLSRREKEILKWIIDEATTAEIAEKLFISIGTVETHRHNMMNKLGVRNTAGLVRVAITHGLIET
ncbi:MAG TPA: response regulator transcription factor [Saprospiraceae bacterium]|nr:response regulator transcription factor [Saprospiraceae bacterium]